MSVKIRFNDFETLTRAIGIPPHESDTVITNRLINKETAEILKAHLLSMHYDVKKPIQLIGIGIKFEENIDSQLELFSTQ